MACWWNIKFPLDLFGHKFGLGKVFYYGFDHSLQKVFGLSCVFNSIKNILVSYPYRMMFFKKCTILLNLLFFSQFFYKCSKILEDQISSWTQFKSLFYYNFLYSKSLKCSVVSRTYSTFSSYRIWDDILSLCWNIAEDGTILLRGFWIWMMEVDLNYIILLNWTKEV